MKDIGLETLIHPQLNDPILDELYALYGKITKLGTLYYKNESITKKEFDTNFKDISDAFEEVAVERFGLRIQLRSANTFAVMPIFNINNISSDYTFNVTRSDVKHAIKQLKTFNKRMDSVGVTIDLKEAKVTDMPKDYYFPMFINIRYMIDDINKEEFAAVVLHETGHIFTLLEMYSKTTNTVSRLADALLDQNGVTSMNRYLGIGATEEDDPDTAYKVYQKLSKNILGVKLAADKHGDETDIEYEADYFVSRFGMSAYLTSGLGKLTGLGQMSMSMAPVVYIATQLLTYHIFILAAIIFLGAPVAILTGVVATIAKLIYNLTTMINTSITGRNPTGDEHGNLTDRFKNIRTGIISLLRTTNLTKKETKAILEQVKLADANIDLVENSFFDSMIGGMITSYFLPNLNLREKLTSTVDELINNELYIEHAKFSIGAEALSYQGKSDPVVQELTDFFTELTSNTIAYNTVTYTKATETLNDIIYKRFGIPLYVYPAVAFGTGFACIPFSFINQTGIKSLSSKINNRFNMLALLNGDANSKYISDIKSGALKIKIDLNKGRIEGLDRKRHNSVLFLEFGRDVFNLTHEVSPAALTPAELAAVTLHEIGHLFTYIENMARTVRTNSLLQEAILDHNTSTKERNVEYSELWEQEYKEFTSFGGGMVGLVRSTIATTLTMAESLLTMNASGGMIESALNHDNTRDKLGNLSTFITDSENLADNFANMFGTGPELATGLRKVITLGVKSKSLIILPLTIYLFKDLLMLALMTRAISGSIIPKLFMLILATSGYFAMFFILRNLYPSSFPYEKLPERFDGIKRGLIRVLRENKLRGKAKSQLIKDIGYIEKEINQVIDSGYGSFIYSIFVPSHNVGVATNVDARLTDMLDKLINNDLHYQAGKFEELGKMKPRAAIENMARGLAMADIRPDQATAILEHGYTPAMEFGTNDRNLRYVHDVSIESLFFHRAMSNSALETTRLINTVLEKYNVQMLYNVSNNKVTVTSQVPLRFSTGIATLAMLVNEPVLGDKFFDTSAIILTIDSIKLIWAKTNKYMAIDNIDKVKLSDDKYLYIYETPILRGELSEEHDALVTSLYKLYRASYISNGNGSLKEVVDNFLVELGDSNIDVPGYVMDQLGYLKEVSLNDRVDYAVELDLHAGNWMTNRAGELVLIDPIYSSKSLAGKTNNDIDITGMATGYEIGAEDWIDKLNNYFRSYSDSGKISFKSVFATSKLAVKHFKDKFVKAVNELLDSTDIRLETSPEDSLISRTKYISKLRYKFMPLSDGFIFFGDPVQDGATTVIVTYDEAKFDFLTAQKAVPIKKKAKSRAGSKVIFMVRLDVLDIELDDYIDDINYLTKNGNRIFKGATTDDVYVKLMELKKMLDDDEVKLDKNIWDQIEVAVETVKKNKYKKFVIKFDKDTWRTSSKGPINLNLLHG